MPDGVDASIYGNLQAPQAPNLLDMGAKAAYMANAMNQNRAFQMQMQARQALAGVAQANQRPDGSLDYNKMVVDLYTNPATAPYAGEVANQIKANGLLDQQTLAAQIANRQTMFDHSMGILAPLAAKGAGITQQDVIGALGEGLGLGLYDINTVKQLIPQLQQFPDQTLGDGSKQNPALAAQIKQMVAATNAGRAGLDKAIGDWTTQDTGAGTYGGFVSRVTGGFTPTQYTPKATPTTVQGPMGGESNVPLYKAPGMGDVPPVQNLQQSPGVAPGQITTEALPPPGQGGGGGGAQPAPSAGGPGASANGGFTTKLAPAYGDYVAGRGPIADYEDQLNSVVAQDNRLVQITDKMSALLEKTATGWGQEFFTEAAKIAQTLGLKPAIIEGLNRGDLNAAVEFKKYAWPAAIDQYKSSAGSNQRITNMQSFMSQATQPSLDMPSGAIKDMQNFTRYLARLDKAEQDDFNRTKQKAYAAAKAGDSDTAAQLLLGFRSAWQQKLVKSGHVNYDWTPRAAKPADATAGAQ